MTNKDILKKKIIYRSTHRGTKEMDLLLGLFTKKNINTLNDSELNDLNNLLQINDEILKKWYFEKSCINQVPINKVSLMLKKFKNLKLWRKGWDSNPRMSCPIAGFQDQCFQPLSHPSILYGIRL